MAILASESHRKLCDQRFQKNRKKKTVSQPYVSVTKAKGEKRFDKRQNSNGVCHGCAKKNTHTHTKSTHTFLRLHFSAKLLPVSNNKLHMQDGRKHRKQLKAAHRICRCIADRKHLRKRNSFTPSHKLATAGIKRCCWFFH